MTLLAPIYFYLSLAAAAGVIVLHCIVTRQPDSIPFPTVRFVPQGEVSIVAFAPPTDPALLALRAGAILLIGLALAHPVVRAGRTEMLRIVLLDRSRMVARVDEARDSAKAWLRPPDLLIPFDSGASNLVPHGELDALALSREPGRLSAGLIAALRAASRHRQDADSLELVIISPVTDLEFDAATRTVRALWPGPIRLVSTAAASDAEVDAHVDTGGSTPEGVTTAASLAGLTGVGGSVRLRRHLQGEDSTWASQPGHTLVVWDTIPSARWHRRERPDQVGGVVAGQDPFLYPLTRAYELTPSPLDRIVARWIDGAPVAAERDVDAGCIREVAIPVPLSGDLILRLPFRHLVSALLAPCHPRRIGSPIRGDERAVFAGTGALARAADLPAPDLGDTPPNLWLLLAAVALLIGEQWLRRRPIDPAGAPAPA